MKKILIIALTIIASNMLVAQNGVLANGKEYKAHAEGWMIDINKAYEVSKKTGKPIMANFTGSDWCGWCKKLKAEVFDTPEFKAWAAKNVVLVELDFPRRFQLPENIKQQKLWISTSLLKLQVIQQYGCLI